MVQTEEKKKKSSLKSFMGGDILMMDFFRRQLKLLLLILVLLMFYINNRYIAQRKVHEIDRLRKELVESKYDALTRNSELMERSRQSRIEEHIAGKEESVKISTNPPYIIKR